MFDSTRLHTLANKRGSTIINAYNYTCDANGNQVTKLDIGGTTTYAYGALNRLASVTEPGGKVTAYTFDGAGNRATQQVTDGIDSALTAYTYNTQNQLLNATETSGGETTSTVFFYDLSGNMISRHEETLGATGGSFEMSLTTPGYGEDAYAVNAYNAFNRLITSEDQDSESSYTYNGAGQRVGKTVTENNVTTVTQFIYEYDKVVLELDGSGSQTAYNVYGAGMLLSRTSDGSTLYYLYNGHSDVVNITDPIGTVVMTMTTTPSATPPSPPAAFRTATSTQATSSTLSRACTTSTPGTTTPSSPASSAKIHIWGRRATR